MVNTEEKKTNSKFALDPFLWSINLKEAFV